MARTNNAGFSAPIEYFGQGSNAKLKLVSSRDGQQQTVLEGTDENGDIVSRDVSGDTLAPEGVYEVAGDLTHADLPAIGSLSTVAAVIDGSSTTVSIRLASITIETGAGQPPKVTLAGKSVEPSAAAGRTFAVPPAALCKHYKAQDALAAATLTGAACALTRCVTVISAEVGTATKGNSPISSDCWGGRAVATLTVQQYGSNAPAVAAAAGWDVTKGLSQSNQDAAYVEWVCELTKSLTATEPAA